jgi:hypothetical protein
MRTISLRLPDDLLAQLDRKAKTRSWLVWESLERALFKESPAGVVSCYDMARDLAGSVQGLSGDLAVNPE